MYVKKDRRTEKDKEENIIENEKEETIIENEKEENIMQNARLLRYRRVDGHRWKMSPKSRAGKDSNLAIVKGTSFFGDDIP